MKKIKYVLIAVNVLVCGVYAQSVRSLVNNGNELYKNKQYSDAEAEYRKSLEKDKSLMQGEYNLGNAVYKQKRFDEAVENYQQALSKTKDAKIQSKLYYNMGNSYFDAKKYQESIQSYKNSLKLNPSDDDAKYNLAYAMRMLKQQQQQKKQQNKNQNQKNKQDKNKDQQQKNDQQQQKNNQQRQQQQQNLADQQKRMSREDAKRILEAIRNDEKKTQKKVREKAPVKTHVEKDW